MQSINDTNDSLNQAFQNLSWKGEHGGNEEIDSSLIRNDEEEVMQEDRSLEQRLKTRSETEVSITIPKGVFLDDLLCERSSSNLDHHSISIIRS